MYFAGIDAHLKYVTVAVVDSFGSLAHKTRVSTEEPQRLLEELRAFRPLQVVVETCPFWPWPYNCTYANMRSPTSPGKTCPRVTEQGRGVSA